MYNKKSLYDLLEKCPESLANPIILVDRIKKILSHNPSNIPLNKKVRAVAEVEILARLLDSYLYRSNEQVVAQIAEAGSYAVHQEWYELNRILSHLNSKAYQSLNNF